MELEKTLGHRMTRRAVVGLVAGVGTSLVLAACGASDDDPDEASAGASSERDEEDEDVTEDSSPGGEDEPDELVAQEEDDEDDEAELEDATSEDAPPQEEEDDTDGEETAASETDAQIIVDDVIDFTLAPEGRWDGPFGSVTMRLHRAWVNDEEATFIRTDASDEEFAEQEGLVFVPLMGLAVDVPGSYADLYLFQDAPDGQYPVMSSSPADGEDFSPAFRIHYVTISGKTSVPITSEQAVLTAADAGNVEIESTDIVVNYPVITWPGGQIPVDEEKVEALGGGQLIEAPDIDAGQVTLKLHQCYPNSRYIITDTSALPMAPMMGAGEAGGSQLLIEANAVAPITIFLNGLEGTGAMGFQPGIFNTSAGDPGWSPFWEHFAAEWVNEDEAVPVTSQQQLDDLVDAGDLTLYGGVPDTDPDTFVVNCSVPVVAPVTWEPPSS